MADGPLLNEAQQQFQLSAAVHSPACFPAHPDLQMWLVAEGAPVPTEQALILLDLDQLSRL